MYIEPWRLHRPFKWVKYMRIAAVLTSLLLALSLVGDASADSSESPFLPTWKLLNNQEKRQFLAGYFYGWQDAHKVTDVAIDFIRDNPKTAVESLQRIQNLYDLSGLDPATATQDLDKFFSDPDHAKATLSGAITALKNARPEVP